MHTQAMGSFWSKQLAEVIGIGQVTVGAAGIVQHLLCRMALETNSTVLADMVAMALPCHTDGLADLIPIIALDGISMVECISHTMMSINYGLMLTERKFQAILMYQGMQT
jgi:hypothetical protein